MFTLEDQINLIPPPGFNPTKPQSEKAFRWLHYKSQELGTTIQHGKEGGEFKVPGCGYADGYINKTKTVVQYHGCFWHACPSCFGHTTINPVTGHTMGPRIRTQRKQRQNLGRRVTVLLKSGNTNSMPY